MQKISTQKWLNLLFSADSVSVGHGEERLGALCREIGSTFRGELATALSALIQRKLWNKEWDFDALSQALTDVMSESPLAKYLVIDLDSEKKRRNVSQEKASRVKLEQLERFELEAGVSNASLWGEKAKLYASVGDFEAALRNLQRAFWLFPDFSFWIKYQAVVELIWKKAPASLFQRELKVGLIGSCTTSFLKQFLKSAGLARGMKLNIYEGPFGNYNQEILDPNSQLYQFQPDSVFLLLESHDFNAKLSESKERIDEYVARIRNLIETFRKRSSACFIFTGLEIPPYGAWGGLEYSESDGRVRRLEELNLKLTENLPEGVAFLSPRQLSALHDGVWTSSRDWYVAKQYPAPAATPVLADAVAASLASFVGLSKRVLALDLDNTCWGGVVGEDGPDGLKIGTAFSDGESYSALQRYAKDLQQKGVLLVVCSKNNENDALQAFAQCPEMILKREDFVAFRANWNDKASNLKSIAKELALGLDSFVFVDDNPVERALVRRELPEVVVPEFDNLHWKIVPTLRRGMFFETSVVTPEDRARHASYRARIQTRRLSESSNNLDEFLRSLQMKSKIVPIGESNLSRVTQLLNKSNQFNLTTRRYTLDETRKIAASDAWRCRAFTLDDAFQQHGIVGVLLAKKDDETSWTIDSLTMSCRVIGRKLEIFMLVDLLNAAKKEGANRVRGLYYPTQKNRLVQDFYANRGFQAQTDGSWLFDLTSQELPVCDEILSILD